MNAISHENAMAISVFTLAIGLSTLAVARDKPAALQALENDFEKNLAVKIQTLYEPYRAALNKLYIKKVKAGKLEEALAVKREIERIKLIHAIPSTKPEKGSATAGEKGSFLLLASNAILAGSIRFDNESQRLIDWKKAGSARWKLDQLPQGTYFATLNYHSGPFAGGRFQVSQEKSTATFSIKGSGKWQEQKRLDLGEVIVGKTAGTLLLTILDTRTQGIMELSRVTLTPKPKPAPSEIAPQ